MNDKLKIEVIKDVFRDKSFTSDNLYHFYQMYDPHIKKNTFRWRVHTLKNDGVIHTLKRGVYATKNKKDFEPAINKRLVLLFSKVHRQFPYIDMCIWETSWLNNLMIHQAFSNNIILEIDKDAAPAVFAFLQESHKDIYLNPGKYEMGNYITADQNSIFIKNLTVTSPLQAKENITIPTVEKIMVDLFVDDEMFMTYQGAELQHIYQELFLSYHINRSRLWQYAHKRHKKDKLISFLKEEANIEEDDLLL